MDKKFTKEDCLKSLYLAYKKSTGLPFSQHYYNKNYRGYNQSIPTSTTILKHYELWEEAMFILMDYIKEKDEEIKYKEEFLSWEKETFGNNV